MLALLASRKTIVTTENLAAGSRWAAAAQLAAGAPDPGLPARRSRIVLSLVAIIVGSGVVGTVTALLTASGAQPDDHISPNEFVPQFAVASTLLLIGLMVGVVGFVWARRTGRFVTRWNSVMSPLSPDEKKDVRGQINGKMEVDIAHEPVILAIARQGQQSIWWLVPLYVTIVLCDVAAAVVATEVILRIFELAIVALYLAVFSQSVVGYRRAGRFIRAHESIASRDRENG